MNDTTTGETTWEKTADTHHSNGNGHDKRDELRAKIEASERRIQERTMADDARDAAVAARDYTRAHPLTVIGGAIGIGILIGLATPPGRRAAGPASLPGRSPARGATLRRETAIAAWR